jgi:methionine salvage enolase-phosphatase E1
VTSPIKVVLLDIEGTTTAIDFVHTTLFDVARRELAKLPVAPWPAKSACPCRR